MAPLPKPKKKVQKANKARKTSAAAKKDKEKQQAPPASCLEAVRACKPRNFLAVMKKMRGTDGYDPEALYPKMGELYYAGMLPKLPGGFRYGRLRDMDAYEAQGHGLVAGVTHFENGRAVHVWMHPVLGFQEADRLRAECTLHEGGVHVVNGVDKTWTKKDDHGKPFLEVAEVLMEKSEVAITVELSEEDDAFLRKLDLELPDEPDWEHEDWLKHFAKYRRSKKYRLEIAARARSFLKKVKEFVIHKCRVTSAALTGSSALGSSADSEGEDVRPEPRRKKLIKRAQHRLPASAEDSETDEDVQRRTVKRQKPRAKKSKERAQERPRSLSPDQSSFELSMSSDDIEWNKELKRRAVTVMRRKPRAKQPSKRDQRPQPSVPPSDDSSSTSSDDSEWDNKSKRRAASRQKPRAKEPHKRGQRPQLSVPFDGSSSTSSDDSKSDKNSKRRAKMSVQDTKQRTVQSPKKRTVKSPKKRARKESKGRTMERAQLRAQKSAVHIQLSVSSDGSSYDPDTDSDEGESEEDAKGRAAKGKQRK